MKIPQTPPLLPRLLPSPVSSSFLVFSLPCFVPPSLFSPPPFEKNQTIVFSGGHHKQPSSPEATTIAVSLTVGARVACSLDSPSPSSVHRLHCKSLYHRPFSAMPTIHAGEDDWFQMHVAERNVGEKGRWRLKEAMGYKARETVSSEDGGWRRTGVEGWGDDEVNYGVGI
ncbi:hypothetical protein Acr_00g0026930 [Actinidia rufa]|uniref:Uncharacterized protein n=1 Tax=Actinidia rufa TaxID=165716 RepID=A0A7J0DFP4_9ERIC|nr:hypothetical protein Acr_00g0026930 [Actinidia rufa]